MEVKSQSCSHLSASRIDVEVLPMVDPHLRSMINVDIWVLSSRYAQVKFSFVMANNSCCRIDQQFDTDLQFARAQTQHSKRVGHSKLEWLVLCPKRRRLLCACIALRILIIQLTYINVACRIGTEVYSCIRQSVLRNGPPGSYSMCKLNFQDAIVSVRWNGKLKFPDLYLEFVSLYSRRSRFT